MRAVVLADNIAADGMLGEWGLSIYIEYNGKKFLLDTGASGKFMLNAEKLHINIEDVEFGILSHAHYDHADGMDDFFAGNRRANFYLREGCDENCYKKKFLQKRYIGIKKGTLQRHKDRIVFAKGNREICQGAALIPHSTEGMGEIGRKNHMYIKRKGWHPDDFSHEQSLVFDTEKGLVIFNSCCHAGVDTIIDETARAFPKKNIYGVIGGFHLYEKTGDEVRALAKRIEKTGIQKVYTGHCTGKDAYRILKEELGDRAERIYTGMEIEV